ncbi:MAG: protein kinase [Anaerolineaceae bacterium]|jgi:predicted Ser/Thr protein kinase|nr:protein kinase [Anaerolineaceae bacterium]
MDLSPDTLLRNRYRIIRPLGKGGMGAVYLAFDNSLELEVAVKYNQNDSEEATSQFLREARILAALRQPNLPRVIDYFVEGQDQYLVMDFVPGETFDDILEKEGPQPLERVLNWTRQLVDALSYLHAQTPPITHRDIKPANIKVTPDGQVMLVDFGIAKIAETAQMTATGARGYTTGYAPPEQYGSARTGPYSDQYSLAATLYRLLSNQKPTDGVQRALGEAVLTPLNLLIPNIPAHVVTALEKAMSPRIQERYESVNAFMQALTDPHFRPETPHLTTVQRPASDPVDTEPQKKKPKGWIWALAAIGGLGVITVIAAGIFLLRGQGIGPFAGATATPQPPPVTVAAAVANAATHTPVPPTLTPLPTQTMYPTDIPATATPEIQRIGDGGLVAFSSDRGDGDALQIWTMRVSLQEGVVTSDQFTQRTFGEGDKTQPAWSPDGTKLVYAAPSSDPNNGTDIYLLDLSVEGKEPVNLTARRGDDSFPAWSPDGKWIAFTNQNQAGTNLIYVMNPAGTDQRKVSTSYDESAPQWSADSKELVFIRFASDHRYLFEQDWQEAPPVYPTPYPTAHAYDVAAFFGRLGQVLDFSLSLDSEMMAYTEIKGRVQRIYVLPYKSRGAELNLLTSDDTLNRQPVFSPDKQWLLFTSEYEPGKPGLTVMTTTGLMRTDLTEHTGIDQEPAWQPVSVP